jgi:hypothetical protein
MMTVSSSAPTLDAWLHDHGPLAPTAALVIALDAAARVSAMTGVDRRRTVQSLDVGSVERGADGRWLWRPTWVETPLRRVSDTDVIERLGGLLFTAVAGEALPAVSQHSDIRVRLRTARPDLPADVVALIARAVSGRWDRNQTLAEFAEDVRRLVGGGEPSRHRRSVVMAAAAAIIAILVFWRSAAGAGKVPIDENGLTAQEEARRHVFRELGEIDALSGELTLALITYSDATRLWGGRLPADDPRVAWTEAHSAWIRLLQGDQISSEQVLAGKPTLLARELGASHPYARTAMLDLAQSFDWRKGTVEATAQRDAARRSFESLAGGVLDPAALDPLPTMPGTLAHVARNDPAREGFRQREDRAYHVLLTETERWLAGREGWRLHVISGGSCQVTFTPGALPGLVSVAIERAGIAWSARVDGVQPAVTLPLPPGDRAGLSLVADGSGRIATRLADGSATRTSLVVRDPLPDPPYALTFIGDAGSSGCQVVWLEIPFPIGPMK